MSEVTVDDKLAFLYSVQNTMTKSIAGGITSVRNNLNVVGALIKEFEQRKRDLENYERRNRRIHIDEQIEHLRRRFSKVLVHNTIKYTSNGTLANAVLLEVGPITTGPEYQEQDINIYVIIPSGYPFTCPDRFYTDGVHFHNGLQLPMTWPYIMNSLWHGTKYMHGFTVTTWNPNTDTLYSYVFAMMQYFNACVSRHKGC